MQAKRCPNMVELSPNAIKLLPEIVRSLPNYREDPEPYIENLSGKTSDL